MAHYVFSGPQTIVSHHGLTVRVFVDGKEYTHVTEADTTLGEVTYLLLRDGQPYTVTVAGEPQVAKETVYGKVEVRIP
jgi:hypothetical protein